MGVLWEILQSGYIYGQKRKSDSMEDRVRFLEDQHGRVQETLRKLVMEIERLHGMDIDGDGKVGP